MGMPSTVKIGAHTFKVVELSIMQGSEKGRYGESAFQSLEIRIVTSHPKTRVGETLLHEIFHALFWQYGIEKGDEEERVVTALSSAIAMVWNDNPLMFEFIRDCLVEAV